MNNVCSRMEEEGFSNCIVTERGYMFGYQTMITDMRSLQIMSELGRPVIFDGSTVFMAMILLNQEQI